MLIIKSVNHVNPLFILGSLQTLQIGLLYSSLSFGEGWGEVIYGPARN
ncbi:hypothetical protein HDF22_004388 [Mucilaginibacter lappiensis]|uniref:Uncharacterized protein n=1 Tax=Mucilaginibacter lappiensis TaxID=354630 RepID=A0A841JNE1_9SPHI|nr:hypothetical protein [Mucilaginibacter lappiensis]